jgi:hypothetical protein
MEIHRCKEAFEVEETLHKVWRQEDLESVEEQVSRPGWI